MGVQGRMASVTRIFMRAALPRTLASTASRTFVGFAMAGSWRSSGHVELHRARVRPVPIPGAVHWSSAAGDGCLPGRFQGLLSW